MNDLQVMFAVATSPRLSVIPATFVDMVKLSHVGLEETPTVNAEKDADAAMLLNAELKAADILASLEASRLIVSFGKSVMF